MNITSSLILARPRLRWVALLLVPLLGAGCGKTDDHDHASHEGESAHEHSHDARHGGVAVVLGDEEFHVEFTHGEKPGVVQAYFFDGHMENYVRVAAPAFPAAVVIDGAARPVQFVAVPNAASGETVGDTALFETTIPALSSQPALTLNVPELVVKGATYQNITAAVPAR